MLNKKHFESSSFRLVVLYAFSVAQPMLALLSGTPEFFAARGSNSGEVLLWLFVLVVLAPLALIAVIELVRRFNSRLGLCLQLFVAFLLLISLTIPIFKSAALMPVGVFEVAVLAVAALLIFIYVRFVPIRSMVSLMGIGLLAFPLVFLFSPGISQLVFYSEEDSSSLNGGGEGVPIVMIVFDELPLFSLMNSDMRINQQRNPNFAALANESTWYRNATTVADFTLGAIPSLLTGNYPPRDELMPFYGNHQQNLFTVLEGSHQIRAVEGAAVLCPTRICGDKRKKSGGGIVSLIQDTLIIYAHIVVPPQFEHRLPEIDSTWQGFAEISGENTLDVTDPKLVASIGKALARQRDITNRFTNFIDSLKADAPPGLDYFHIVFPHIPFRFVPSGKSYDRQTLDGLVGDRWTNDWLASLGQQRYLLQLAYVDKMLGAIVAKLKSIDRYENTLLIVTSDHGASYKGGVTRKHSSDDNYMDLMAIPLLIKYPGQQLAVIDDRNVETIDILPTIADFTNTELSEKVDGHSLLDENTSKPEKFLMRAKERQVVHYTDTYERTKESVADMVELFGSSLDDLFKLGPYAGIIGRKVEDFQITKGVNARVSYTLGARRLLYSDTAAYIPSFLKGTIYAPSDKSSQQELSIAFAVNGTIAAVSQTFFARNRNSFSVLLPEKRFVSGNNAVEAYLIEGASSEPSLAYLQAD